jgi:oxygen-independent coproporphyrinogen III oxidase
VYIHYPWCRNRCPYCDFPIALARAGIPHERYLAAVLAELAERAAEFAGRELRSIYFGGGTPSLWPASCVAAAVDSVRAAFPGAGPPGSGSGPEEVTLEANPVDATPENLAAWREAGVTRVSLGVQSADERELAFLGRDHRMGDGLAALAATLGAGFESVTADVILGAPAGSGGIESVKRIADLGPPHLSVYELTIEERAPLGRAVARGEVTPLREERLAELLCAAHEELEARGYEHYEVSSYAQPGMRAIHNSLYWCGAEFLGLGNGAASFRLVPGGAGRRWVNHRAVNRYLAARGRERVGESEELTAAEVETDRIWLGMRTADGVDERAFAGRGKVCDWLLAEGLAERKEGRIRPTLRGFLYADQVAGRVVTWER